MNTKKRPAFVTTLAVMMIALVAVALMTLTTRLGTAARQTSDARERAQAQQLIQAGVRIAAEKKADMNQTIPLPSELSEAGAILKVTVRGKQVHVEARYGRCKLTVEQ